MEEKGVFRTALGGFNKSDVLGYIDRITADWDEERQRLTQAADKLRRQLAQEQAKNRSAVAEMMAAEDRLSACRDETEALRERLGRAEERQRHFAALFGQEDALCDRLAQIVQPAASDAYDGAAGVLDDTDAALHAMLARLGELCEQIAQRREVLAAGRSENERRLHDAIRALLAGSDAADGPDGAAGADGDAARFFR